MASGSYPGQMFLDLEKDAKSGNPSILIPIFHAKIFSVLLNGRRSKLRSSFSVARKSQLREGYHITEQYSRMLREREMKNVQEDCTIWLKVLGQRRCRDGYYQRCTAGWTKPQKGKRRSRGIIHRGKVTTKYIIRQLQRVSRGTWKLDESGKWLGGVTGFADMKPKGVSACQPDKYLYISDWSWSSLNFQMCEISMLPASRLFFLVACFKRSSFWISVVNQSGKSVGTSVRKRCNKEAG